MMGDDDDGVNGMNGEWMVNEYITLHHKKQPPTGEGGREGGMC